MNRKIFFLLTFGCLSIFSLQGQAIVFDSTSAPKSGNSDYLIQSDFHRFNAGSGGTKLTWRYDTVFHVVHGDSISRHYFMPSSTPFSSLYPSANLSEHLAYDSLFEYLIVSSKGYFLLGDLRNTKLNEDSSFCNPGKMLLPFGVTYLDTVTNSYTVNMQYSVSGNSYSSHTKGVQKFIVDAYGTIITPNSTYPNVLRIKVKDSYSDSNFIKVSGVYKFSNCSNFTSYSYIWVQNNDKQPVVMVIYCDTSGTMANTGYYTYALASTNVNDNLTSKQTFSVYPNPTQNAVTIHNLSKTPLMPYSVEILNTLGQTVWSSVQLTGNTQISTIHFPAGNYLCRIVQNGGAFTMSLVVSH